jgi:hypothetical protein
MYDTCICVQYHKNIVGTFALGIFCQVDTPITPTPLSNRYTGATFLCDRSHLTPAT